MRTWFSKFKSGDRGQIQRFTLNDMRSARRYFEKHGYVVFSDAFDIGQGHSFWNEVEESILSRVPLTFSVYGKFHTNPDVPLEGFKLPRIIDAENFLDSARDLALGPIVGKFFSELYGQLPTCLQSLTYKYSSEQGPHSDISLVSPPHSPGYDRNTLLASWFALEDADERNGALIIYPGSHRVQTRSFYDGFGNSYDRFSAHCVEASQAAGCEPVVFRAKAGDVLFWHGNLVHAGGPIQDREAQPTRKSFVCHYAKIDPALESGDARWAKERHPGGLFFRRTSTAPLSDA